MSITVYAPGCWDLFHVGHLRFLEAARSLGDRLVVGVASDSVIRQDKMRSPIIFEDERIEIVRGLRCVTSAVLYHQFGFIRELDTIHPRVLAVGEFWGGYDRHSLAELWMADHGGKVVRIPYTKQTSTTRIIERIQDLFREELHERVRLQLKGEGE